MNAASVGDFLLWNTGAEAEVWEVRSSPCLLAVLGFDVKESFFDAQSQHIFVRFRNGSAALFDVPWLYTLGGAPEKLSALELIRLACDKARAGGISEEQLAPYLNGQQPQSCR